MRSSAVRRSVAPLLFLLAACKEDPSFDVTAAATTASLQQNGSGSVALTITRKNLDRAVNLSIEGTVPTGITASFSDNPVQPGSTTSTLLLGASASMAPGTVDLTVKASVEGQADILIPIEITVTLRGSHTLALSSSSMTVSQGGGGSATVLVNRVGSNAGNVTLTANAPAGITASFGQSPTTGSATSVTIAAAASVAPGSYAVVITGAQPGVTPDPQTTLTVTVQTAPATAIVSLPVCTASLPAFFAYKNDGFNWVAPALSGNAYTFAATDKLAIAFAFSGNGSVVFVQFGSRAELSTVGVDECSANRSLTGTTTNATAAHAVSVGMGPVFVQTVTNNAFTVSNLPSRALDLVAFRGSSSGNLNRIPDRLAIRRGVTQASGALTTIDFTGSESAAPSTSSLTISNRTANEDMFAQVRFFAATYTRAVVFQNNLVNSTMTVHSVAPAQMLAGDIIELYSDVANSALTDFRTQTLYLSSIADRSEALGPVLTAPSVSTAASAPYVQLRAQLPSQSEYPTGVNFEFTHPASPATPTRRIILRATAAWFGGPPAIWDLTFPDLSASTSFQSSWMIPAGQTFDYSAEAFFTAHSSLLFGADAVVGDVLRSAFKQGLTGNTGSALRAGATQTRGARPSPDRLQRFSR